MCLNQAIRDDCTNSCGLLNLIPWCSWLVGYPRKLYRREFFIGIKDCVYNSGLIYSQCLFLVASGNINVLIPVEPKSVV